MEHPWQDMQASSSANSVPAHISAVLSLMRPRSTHKTTQGKTDTSTKHNTTQTTKRTIGRYRCGQSKALPTYTYVSRRTRRKGNRGHTNKHKRDKERSDARHSPSFIGTGGGIGCKQPVPVPLASWCQARRTPAGRPWYTLQCLAEKGQTE